MLSLHEAAKLTDYDAAFFTSAAVDISSTGIEVSKGAIRLKGDVKEGKVTFTTKENKLEVEIANYVAPPAPQVPEDAEGFAYRFFGNPATLDDILAENSIVSSYNSIVSLSDKNLVAIEKDGSLSAKDYFDAVTLTVALTDGSEVEIILSNPAPVKVDETVITAGVGSFAAAEAIPAGTKLVVNDTPVGPEGIKIGGSAAKDEETEPAKDSGAKGGSDEPTRGVTETKRGADGNETVKLESSPAFYDISLVGPDGKELETGASVTVSASIPLEEAPEGQKLHVTGVNVYHITETEDGGYQVEQLESTGFALADGVISEVSFTTLGFSLFAITYTYEFIKLTGTINLDFTGFVPYPKEGVDATFIYDTDNCDIRVSIDKVLGAALTVEAAGDGVVSEKPEIENFEIDLTKLYVNSPKDGVSYIR